MANVDLVSFSITDVGGHTKSVPLYFPTGMTLANIQAGVNAFAPVVDAVIDGIIAAAQVTLALTLPGGLRSTPGPQRVNIGALLGFDAANTAYKHSIYIPSWRALYMGQDGITLGGPEMALINGVLGGLGTGGSELKPSDKFQNDLTSFLSGDITQRK